MISHPIELRGVVAMVRMNRTDDPALPLTWMEYLKRQPQLVLRLSADPVREWTRDRDEAEVMGWDAANKVAAEIPGAHSIVASLRIEELDAPADGERSLAEAREAVQARQVEPEPERHGVARVGRGGSRSRWRRSAVPPDETFDRLEKEHLA